MKKKIIAGVAITAACAAALTGCSKKPQFQAEESKRVPDDHTESRLYINDYDMDVTLDTEGKTLSSTVTVELENNTEKSFEEVMFFNPAHKYGQAWDVKNVYLGKDSSGTLSYTIDEKNASLLKVDLGDAALASKDKLTLTLEVNESIPENNTAFGHYTVGKYNEYVLGSCFPKVVENIDGEWIIPNTDIADTVFSQPSDYHVKLHAPDNYKAVASGTETKSDDGTINIEAVDTRDFGIVVSDGFRSYYWSNDNITIYYYYIDGANNHEYIRNMIQSVVPIAIDWMTDRMEDFPWHQYDIVQIYDDSDTTSYTALTTFGGKNVHDGIGADVENELSLSFMQRFTKGLIKQWFTEITGSNEATDGWLSKGFYTWFADYVHSHMYKETINRDIDDEIKKMREEHPKEMSMKLNDTFPDSETADIVNSYRGAEFLEELYNELGDEGFISTVREYLNAHIFKDADTDAFLKVLEKHSSGNTQGIVDKYFNK